MRVPSRRLRVAARVEVGQVGQPGQRDKTREVPMPSAFELSQGLGQAHPLAATAPPDLLLRLESSKPRV
jgi:hypothetical protein